MITEQQKFLFKISPTTTKYLLFSRIFHLKLHPDSSTFAENLVIESTRGPLDFNPDITYSGTLEGNKIPLLKFLIFLKFPSWLTDDETATVHGIITKDGLFEGTISTATDEFHIEPLLRYLTNNNTLDTQSYYHSVIYKASDVHNPSESLPCASHLLHQKHNQDTPIKSRQKRWLLQADAKQPYNDDNFWKQFKPAAPALPPDDLNNPYNQRIDDEMQVKSSRIVADLSFRNVIKRAVDPRKTTCMLYLQADHQFFARYRSEEACIEVMTRHVQRVNAIYRNTGKKLVKIGCYCPPVLVTWNTIKVSGALKFLKSETTFKPKNLGRNLNIRGLLI